MTSFVLYAMTSLLLTTQVYANSWAISPEQIKNLAEDPVWQALLHTHNGKPYVKDARFLLSWPQFGLEQEFSANLTQLQDAQTHDAYICKFPARAVWLQQQLGLPKIDFSKCDEFQDYLRHVPVDKIQLVYVSENMTQPSSMMGHVLLGFSGEQDGRNVEHAISFFTEAQSLNVPKLLFDTMVVGKKGYFSLTPLDEKIERYHHQEQRNVWFYDLNLTDEQKQRMLYHAWELKTAPLKYFFNKYNCATLTHFMLATTGNAQLGASFNGAMSPLDVAKSVETARVIEQKTLLPANKSMIRMLSNGQSTAWTEQIKASVLGQNIPDLISSAASDQDRFLRYQVAKTYKSLLVDQHALHVDEAALDQQFNQVGKEVPTYFVDLSQYKNPLKAHAESQLSMGAGVDRHHNILHGDYLVAGHHLEDDNTQYANESELLLGGLGLNVDLTEQKPSLDYLNVYSMATYIPRDTLTGGLSGHFKMTYAPMMTPNLTWSHRVQIGGGAGLTYQIVPSVDVFMLGSAIIYANLKQQGVDLFPTAGVMLRENWGLKSIVQYERHVDTTAFSQSYDHIKLIQSKQINSQYSLNFFGDYYKNAKHTEQSYFLMLRHYF